MNMPRTTFSLLLAVALTGACATAPVPAASAPTAEPPPAAASSASSQSATDSSTGAAGTARRIQVHVETHPSQGEQRTIEGARATLLSTAEGLGVRVETTELTPGHVHTLWVVAINRPEACAASPCSPQDVLGNTDAVRADVIWGDGMVADADGEAELSAWVPAGPWKTSWFGHGYTAGDAAEVHVVVNDHGPALPGRLASMMSTTRDGCTDDSVPPTFPASAKGDGEAGPNACALVQDAIFVHGR